MGAFGDTMTTKWAVIAIVTVGILLFILKAKPFSFGKQKGFYWSITGALVRTYWNFYLLGISELGWRIRKRYEFHNAYRRTFLYYI